MPIHGYPGGVISATAPTISPTSASGVWTLDDQLQNAANWPSQSNIARSLRFNSADSAYLSRTPGSAGNRKAWTWSAWVKRSALGSSQYFMSAYTTTTDAGFFGCRFTNTDVLSITGYSTEWLGTTQVFRDVSGWYHFVIAVDTTQATANNRIRFYVNGSEVTAFATRNNPTQNDDLGYNGNWAHTISSNTITPNQFFNGYLADVYFIDGQQLTPSSFGYTDSNGIWQPNSYTGSYGTNGFWLNFDDNSGTTATTLGKDSSGNGNNWTPNNFSVTAGAGNDSLVDSPTNYGTDTGVGGEVRGNYCTWNRLDFSSNITIANGSLDASISPATWYMGRATTGMTSGKWYWEVRVTGGTASPVDCLVGIATQAANLNDYLGGDAYGWGYYGNGGGKYTGGGFASYGASFTTNDTIGVAFDADAGTLVFYKNGVSQGTAYTGLTSGPYFPAVGLNAANVAANFGQRPFAYTAPAGFKALCSTNLPTPTILSGDDYFNTVLYTGTGSTQSITGVGFQPDWVWIKKRSGAESHALSDVLRGTNNILISNSTAGDNTASGTLTAFGSDGFTVGAQGIVNDNTFTFVSWNWKAGGTGVSNTAGSITSTVSANQTAGFSVVTFTGNGTAGATVGHGLGAAPRMIIVKSRGNARNWLVYHASIGATQFLQLDTTIAATSSTTAWNDTAPSSTVFTLGTSSAGNESGITRVAYCFASVPGYSAFGSYTGNGSTDGPFIYTGFRPAYLLIKRSNDAADWYVYDAKRNTYNALNSILSPNLSNADATNSAYDIDFTANGFKLRLTATYANSNASTYIYAAFAESPFKISRAR